MTHTRRIGLAFVFLWFFIGGIAHFAAIETEMRIVLLNAWREAALYSPRERAALAWTEALTRLSEAGAPDALYADLRTSFTEAEQVQLTLQIGAINLWNRLQVGLRGVHHPDPSRDAA